VLEYDDRPGIPAYNFPDKVSSSVKHQRKKITKSVFRKALIKRWIKKISPKIKKQNSRHPYDI
jgi:tRNA A37 methylthiotransferase MiaB